MSDLASANKEPNQAKRTSPSASIKMRRRRMEKHYVDLEKQFLAWLRTCILLVSVGVLLIGWGSGPVNQSIAVVVDAGRFMIVLAAIISASATFAYLRGRTSVKKAR